MKILTTEQTLTVLSPKYMGSVTLEFRRVNLYMVLGNKNLIQNYHLNLT